MFWKVIGGIVVFFMVVALAVGLLATASLAAVGIAVDSALENLEYGTVQVTDESGHTQTYSVEELLSNTERVDIRGENGEQVIIDMAVPQVTVKERGKDAQVIINGEDKASVVLGGESDLEIRADGSLVRIDGRSLKMVDNFDGGHLGRLIAGFFRGLFNLVFLTLIVVGIWLLVRSRKSETTEKKPNAQA